MGSIIFGIGVGPDAATQIGISELDDGVIPVVDAGLLAPSSAAQETDESWVFNKKIEVPSASIDIGGALSLSEGTAELICVNRLKDAMAFSVNAKFDDSVGSSLPSYFDYDSTSTLNIQTTDTTVISTNPLTFDITGTVTAPNVRMVDQLTLRANGAMPNTSAKFTDNATGIVVRYIPDRDAFENGGAGLNLIVGDNVFFFASDDEDTPGNFHLGFTPFIIENGQQIDVEFRSDSIDLLGDATEFPYLVAESHDGTPTSIQTNAGAALTERSVPFANSLGHLTEDNANFNFNDTTDTLNVDNLNVNGDLNMLVEIDGGSASIHFKDESSLTRAQVEYQDGLQRLLIDSGESSISLGGSLTVFSAASLNLMGAGDVILNSNIEIDGDGQIITLTSEGVSGTPSIQFNDSSDADAGSIRFDETDDDLTITAALGDLQLASTSSDVELLPGSGITSVNFSSGLSKLHVFENTASTGQAAGFTVQNDGVGDAVTHLVTPTDTWSYGYDQSLNQFAIRSNIALSAAAQVQILPTGELGINKTPRANHCLDIDTTTNTVVALYDQKDVTLEQGNSVNTNSTDLFFNRADVGFNQSEFHIFNENDNTDTMRHFHLNYTDAGTVGGLSVRFNGFVAVGIGSNDEADTLFHLRSEGDDTVAVQTLETTGANGANTDKGVGSRDPNTFRTGTGGDEHVRVSGATSGTYESREATTGTTWFKRSVLPATIIQINTAAEFEELATAGTITITVDTAIIFNIQIVTTTVFDISGGGDLTLSSANDTAFVYVGTGTLFTISGAAGTALIVRDLTLFATSTATWFDVTGGIDLAGNGTRVDLINMATIGGSLGAFRRASGLPSGPLLFANNSSMINRLGGFVCSDTFVTMGDMLLISLVGVTSGEPFVEISTTTALASQPAHLFHDCVVSLSAGESFSRVDAGLSEASAVTVRGLQVELREDSIGLFDTSGATGTFTAVSDASVAATTVTSVTNITDDIARFNFTGPTLFINQEVDIVDFVANTNYNQKALITDTDGTTYFEVDYIAFGTNEASVGSFTSDSITLTDTTTTLVDGDTIKLDTDGATDYIDGVVVYNQTTNTIQVNQEYDPSGDDPQTGTWSQAGLDQTDRLVLASGNPQFDESHHIATAFVNDNAEANGAITNDVFTDMVFGTVGDALIAGSTMERYKLVDEVNGTLEDTGREGLDNFIQSDFTFESSGGSVDFFVKWVRSSNAIVANSFIAFANANPDEIFSQFNDFITAGFKPDDEIDVSGSSLNDGTYTIAEVAAGKITLVGSDTLVDESAGAAVTITALFSDLKDNVIGKVNVGSDAQSITKKFPIKTVERERIKPQITRGSGNSGIVTTHATINAGK